MAESLEQYFYFTREYHQTDQQQQQRRLRPVVNRCSHKMILIVVTIIWGDYEVGQCWQNIIRNGCLATSQCGIKRPNNPFEELLIVLERTIAEDSWQSIVRINQIRGIRSSHSDSGYNLSSPSLISVRCTQVPVQLIIS